MSSSVPPVQLRFSMHERENNTRGQLHQKPGSSSAMEGKREERCRKEVELLMRVPSRSEEGEGVLMRVPSRSEEGEGVLMRVPSVRGLVQRGSG